MILYEGIKLFISLALPFIAGYTFLNFLFRKSKLNFTTSLALSYGLGLGILTQWMLLLSIAGIKYSVPIIGTPLVISSLVFGLLAYKKDKKNHFSPKPEKTLAADKSITTTSSLKILHRALYILLSAYVICYILYIFWRALNIPVYTWDAIYAVAFKAKVFFFSKSIPPLKNLPLHFYPLHVPLIQTWIAINLGTWNDQLIKIIFPFAFLSFLIIHNDFLTYYTNRKWALLGTVLLVSSNMLILHATISYRDLFLLYYNCTIIILLFFWRAKKDDAFLILASLYAGFATFIKLEGTAYLLIHTAIFFLILLHEKKGSFRKNLNKILKFAIPSFGICFLHNFHKILTKVSPQKIHFDFTLSSLERTPTIFKIPAENMFLSGNWNIIWFLLALSLVINFAKIKKNVEIRLLFIAMVLFFEINFLYFLLTDSYKWISILTIGEPLTRLILHFFHLATMLIILLNYPNDTSLYSANQRK